MKVKNVLSMSQMLHLKDLGFNIDDASMAWTRMVTDMGGNHIDRPWRLLRNEPIAISNMEDYESIPTFTLADILNVLPKYIETEWYDAVYKRHIKVIWDLYILGDWEVGYADEACRLHCISFENKELIDAAYKMLCWLIEKGHIETKKKEV